MRVAIACDHRGYAAKRRLSPVLRSAGNEIEDFGCDGTGSCDYMDHGVPAARAVASGRVDMAILIDGSGIGMSIVANKILGVRAALAHDEIAARIARESNHCNVLCIGADLLSEAQIRKVIHAFMATKFGEGRHLRRVEKIRQIEEEERIAREELMRVK
jgi:ribose 5-phosphate isomerase B